MDENGKREIASHYYPLIGPYDSSDPDVLEYHLLLMKYAGIDAVLIDWYGVHNVYDYKVNLTGSNAFINKMDDVGLQFAIVYEEYTAQSVGDQTQLTPMEAAKADLSYMETQYFTKPEYAYINDKPLLMTFGPRYFKQSSQWTQIFDGLSTKPCFLPLWNHGSFVGNNGNGEYSWVDFEPSLNQLTSFYGRTSLEVLMGSAYPRFHDFYAEGGTGTSYGYVDFANGKTLINTLNKAKLREIEHLQLVTWNDFGEGTVLEPTLEDGFKCLEIIQEFTGVDYGLEELELIHRYFLKKKKYEGDEPAIKSLQKAFEHLSALEVPEAKAIVDSLL